VRWKRDEFATAGLQRNIAPQRERSPVPSAGSRSAARVLDFPTFARIGGAADCCAHARDGILVQRLLGLT
jgi:hypothetical protein